MSKGSDPKSAKACGSECGSISESAIVCRFAVVLCLHKENLNLNPHGIGIRLHVRENILDANNLDCWDCGLRCMQDASHRITKEDTTPSRLWERRMRQGFLLLNPDDLKTIQAGLKTLHYHHDEGVAVELRQPSA